MANAQCLGVRLTDAERQRYQDEGYLVLRGLFPAEEIVAAAIETESLLAREDIIVFENLRCTFQLHCDTDAWLLDSFEPVIDISPACASLAADTRLLTLLASLYSEEACLFKDRLILKPPGAVGYKLHQDHRLGIISPLSVVSVIIPLDRTTVDNGCTELFPGYHSDLGFMDGDVYVFPPGLVDETKAVPLELHPGDLALMHCLTPHRSGVNRTESWRRQLFLDYNARSDGGDCRARYYAEHVKGLKRTLAKTGISNTYFL